MWNQVSQNRDKIVFFLLIFLVRKNKISLGKIKLKKTHIFNGKTLFVLEGNCAPNWQDRGVHSEDGEGGGHQGQDVLRDHSGLPHLLGAALPCDSPQLGLGVGGCRKVLGPRCKNHWGHCICWENMSTLNNFKNSRDWKILHTLFGADLMHHVLFMIFSADIFQEQVSKMQTN